MKTRFIAALIVLGVIATTGVFVWGALTSTTPVVLSGDRETPTASVSEILSDGRLDFQVYAAVDRDIRLEIKFMPDTDASELAGMRPDVNLAMVDEHRDGFDPPLELIEAGRWRARFKLPRAGRWVVNVGFGEDFAEVEFDAR